MSTDFQPRPCDRCGCGEAIDEYAITQPQQPLCCEFQLGYGVISWLCFNCRRDWIKVIDSSHLLEKYGELSFRLEFWRLCLGPSSPDSEEERGLSLHRDLNSCEKEIKEFAYQWIISGQENATK